MDEYEATKKLFAHLSDERLRTLYEAVKKHATRGDPTDRALLAHMEDARGATEQNEMLDGRGASVRHSRVRLLEPVRHGTPKRHGHCLSPTPRKPR
jgi:hypothetical protein